MTVLLTFRCAKGHYCRVSTAQRTAVVAPTCVRGSTLYGKAPERSFLLCGAPLLWDEGPVDPENEYAPLERPRLGVTRSQFVQSGWARR